MLSWPVCWNRGGHEDSPEVCPFCDDDVMMIILINDGQNMLTWLISLLTFEPVLKPHPDLAPVLVRDRTVFL